MVQVSQRGQRMPASPIRRLVPFADAAGARGVHVHFLNIGQPDVPTPRGMIDAYRTFDREVLAYGPSQGLPELRAAKAAYYREHGQEVQPEHVTVTTGGSEAILFAFAAVSDPGDAVLCPEPFYANYLGFAVSAGVELQPVRASAADGFRLPSDEAFRAALTERTRAIIINSPGNPTGTVYRRDELERVARLAAEHELYIVSDEVYRDFSYVEGEVPSALSLPGADERVILVDSVSKRYSACGARIGFAISRNAAINDAIMRMCFARLCPATVDQLAAVEAYRTPASYFHEMVAEYRKRRDVLVEGLNAIDGVSSYLPEGAFYTIATLPVDDVDHFAQWMLTDFAHEGETVLIAPGTGFYATPGLGTHEARIAYVLEVEALKRALAALRAALAAYPGSP